MKTFLLATLILVLSASHALSAKYTFTPRFNIDSYYTDNLFRDDFDQQEDIVTTLTLGLEAGVEVQKAGLDVYFDPSYRFYKDFSERDGWLYDIGLNGFLDLTRNTRLTLVDDFAKRDDQFVRQQVDAARGGDTGARGSLDPTVRQGRSPFWTNVGELRLDHQFGARNNFFALYNNRILRNDASDRFEDSDAHRGEAGVDYYWSPKWGAGLSGVYVRGLFDPSNDFDGIPTDDFDAYGGFFRIFRNINPRTSATLEYGYSHLAYDNGTIIATVPTPGAPEIVVQEDFDVHAPQIRVEYGIEEDITLNVAGGWFWRINDITDNDSGPILNLILRKNLQRGGVRLEGGAGYDFSFFTAQNLGFTRFYRLGVTADYELFRRFNGDIFGAWRRSEFLDEIPQRDDDRYLAGGGFTWQPVRWAAIRLAYQLSKVDSNDPGFTYTENRFFLNLTFSPNLPYTAFF